MDHLYQIHGVGAEDEPMLEGWSVLNALARETKSVRLGTQVSGVTYRNPALMAKMATTLDVISGGRAMMGLGAAWNEHEHDGYGYDFPVVKERMDRLDEALTIIRAMFKDERPSFAGNFYSIDEALNVPRPVQPGGPPIMVGGGGEQRTLRIAAKHADMTHWFPLGLETLQHKTDLLMRYCDDIGRDPAEIERVMGTPVIVAATAAEADAHMAQLPPERRAHVVVHPPERRGRGAAALHRGGFHAGSPSTTPCTARLSRSRRSAKSCGLSRHDGIRSGGCSHRGAARRAAESHGAHPRAGHRVPRQMPKK